MNTLRWILKALFLWKKGESIYKQGESIQQKAEQIQTLAEDVYEKSGLKERMSKVDAAEVGKSAGRKAAMAFFKLKQMKDKF